MFNILTTDAKLELAHIKNVTRLSKLSETLIKKPASTLQNTGT